MALLATLNLEPPDGPRVGEIVVVGPTGRHVLLLARPGRNYPNHGIVVTRFVFDAWLRETAIAAGAEPVTGRVAGVRGETVELDDGRCLGADVVIGADGANSVVAAATGLIETDAVLWGFAQRSYVAQHVDRPIIALWDDPPGHGFPGYGWLFPGANGTANIGLGIGVRADRSSASRAVTHFDAFCDQCRRLGLLSAPVDGRRLGGWLKMGMVGTAAEFVLAGPGSAAIHYRQHLARGPGRYAAVAAPFHAGLISMERSPRRRTPEPDNHRDQTCPRHRPHRHHSHARPPTTEPRSDRSLTVDHNASRRGGPPRRAAEFELSWAY